MSDAADSARATSAKSGVGSQPRAAAQPKPGRRRWHDWPFFTLMGVVGGFYVVAVIALLVADVAYMVEGDAGAIQRALADPDIRYAIILTLVSCTITAILSLWLAVPIGYLMARYRFPGRNLVDAILDIPIVLPPLVVGLSLLIVFQYLPESWRNAVVYQVPGVVVAQLMVAAAFAVRTMRATFEQMDPRQEQVALTLGCTRAQAFLRVVLPQARRGMLTAGTLAWARAMGEFGPLLVFAGATRGKTEVLSTTVFLELSIGDLSAAVAVSLIMVIAALVVLVVARVWGVRGLGVSQ